jgi:hypothetical protein
MVNRLVCILLSLVVLTSGTVMFSMAWILTTGHCVPTGDTRAGPSRALLVGKIPIMSPSTQRRYVCRSGKSLWI